MATAARVKYPAALLVAGYLTKEQESERLLGFVMINTHMQKSGFGHSIAEFMVLPKFRRKGIGKSAAILCFEKYPGAWEVSPSYGSEQAYLFWKIKLTLFQEGLIKWII